MDVIFKPRRVLLIDDDYESMYPLKNFLELEYGCEVWLTAEESILQRLGQEKFDLVCADVMILRQSLSADNQPVNNIHFQGIHWQRTGVEFLKRLRQGEFTTNRTASTSAYVPVIMISAVVEDLATELMAGSVNNYRYMEKPFTLTKFTEIINSLMKEQAV